MEKKWKERKGRIENEREKGGEMNFGEEVRQWL